MGVSPRLSVKLAEVNVEASMARLKVTVTRDCVLTPTALSAGLVAMTAGGLLSASVPVVKLQDRSMAKLPPAVDMAPARMVTV